MRIMTSVCCAPFPHDHQSDRFPPSWKKRYNVCLVNSGRRARIRIELFLGCFSVRNRFMVDSSSLLICYFDGQASGTAQTVHYAQGSGLRIINLPRAYDQLSCSDLRPAVPFSGRRCFLSASLKRT